MKAQVDTVFAEVIDANDYRFAYTPKDYRHQIWDGWGIRNEQFYINNFSRSSDKNLKSVWSSKSAIGTQFKYKPHIDAGCFCCGDDFYGIISVFNGDCSSDVNHWLQFGRIKSIDVYWNETLLCNVQLFDTWHYQTFDIGIYFKCKWLNRNLNAPYEYEMSDELTFEIIEVFEGSEFTDVRISEILWQNAPN